MQKFNNLPLYVFDVDNNPATEEGVEFVALVDKPAIKRNFMAFREEEAKRLAFAITSEDRRIVSGPLMLADTPIYRRQKWEGSEEEEFYVTFPPAAIERMVHKFFQQGNQGNVNLMHDSGQVVDGVTMFESFISDSTRGISAMKGFEDAPEGSWFGSFVVNNPDVWASIKDGTFKGFSVEGVFARVSSEPVQAKADGWWNDPDLEFSEEERKKMSEVWEVLENIE